MLTAVGRSAGSRRDTQLLLSMIWDRGTRKVRRHTYPSCISVWYRQQMTFSQNFKEGILVSSGLITAPKSTAGLGGLRNLRKRESEKTYQLWLGASWALVLLPERICTGLSGSRYSDLIHGNCDDYWWTSVNLITVITDTITSGKLKKW